MTGTNLLYAVLGIFVGAGSLAISAQDRPGIPTQARVWIENRNSAEAVPVKLIQEGQPPHQVEVVGARSTLPVKATRQLWDYRLIQIPAVQDSAALLQRHGDEGWELVSVEPTQSGAFVGVFKRPR